MRQGQGCHRHVAWYAGTLVLLAMALAPVGVLLAEDVPADVEPLPRPPRPAAANAQTTVVDAAEVPFERRYQVADLVLMLQQQLRCDEAQAVQRLGQMVVLGHAPNQTSKRDQVRMAHDVFVVRETSTGHRQIEQKLAVLREFGLAPVHFEIQVITARPAAVQAAVGRWQLAPSGGEPHLATLLVGPDLDTPTWPLPAPTARSRGRVEAATGIRAPSLYNVFDEPEIQRMLQQLRDDEHTMTVAMPQIVTPNTRVATLFLQTQRPFVVGLDGHDPQIRVVSEGLRLRLRPVLRPGGKVWLNCQLSSSEITAVHQTTINIEGRPDPLPLQLPEVHETRLALSTEMPLGQSLVIGGPSKHEPDGAQQLLVVMRASRVAVDEAAAAADGRPRRSPAVVRLSGHPAVTGTAVVRGRFGGDAQTARHDVVPPAAAWPHKDIELSTQVHVVSDLIAADLTPVAPPAYQHRSLRGCEFDVLIELIRKNVASLSWDESGGDGAIEMFPTNLALIVSQTAAVHEQVAAYLDELRAFLNLPPRAEPE